MKPKTNKNRNWSKVFESLSGGEEQGKDNRAAEWYELAGPLALAGIRVFMSKDKRRVITVIPVFHDDGTDKVMLHVIEESTPMGDAKYSRYEVLSSDEFDEKYVYEMSIQPGEMPRGETRNLGELAEAIYDFSGELYEMKRPDGVRHILAMIASFFGFSNTQLP